MDAVQTRQRIPGTPDLIQIRHPQRTVPFLQLVLHHQVVLTPFQAHLRAGVADTVWRNVEAGVYFVRAENQWDCTRDMGAQSVITQQPPYQTSITGGLLPSPPYATG